MILCIYRRIRLFYRQLWGYRYNTILLIVELRKLNLIKNIKWVNSILYFDFAGLFRLKARIFPHSDLDVFKQVLQQQEYKLAVDWVIEKKIPSHTLKIIDAGANVGYTSVYFLSKLSGAQILSIEPDENNFKLLTENLGRHISEGYVVPICAALLSESNIPFVINRSEGDKKDWSFSVTPSLHKTGLTSVSISSLISLYRWSSIDILKIDIEGSEEDVFSETADLSYLYKTRVLLIEIHDDKADRLRIHKLLIANGFILHEESETTFAINSNFI